MTTLAQFIRRHTAKGTLSSVCRGCFLTVATASTESELEEFELVHVCRTTQYKTHLCI